MKRRGWYVATRLPTIYAQRETDVVEDQSEQASASLRMNRAAKPEAAELY